MAKDSPHQTHYTRQVHHLLAKVYGRSAVKDSLLDRAIEYFEHEEFKPSDDKTSPENSQLDLMQRTERHSNLLSICNNILEFKFFCSINFFCNLIIAKRIISEADP